QLFTNHQSPITDYRSQITDYRLQITLNIQEDLPGWKKTLQVSSFFNSSLITRKPARLAFG
ncbi:MAG: hypothetical protein RBS23_07205, partial [Mariniphaga sp.]|nr:hypothetical protein [Mariniphaga sp.]